jgi:diaminopimelate decarboxylase
MAPAHAIDVGRRLAAVPGVELAGLHVHVLDRSQEAMSTSVGTLAEVSSSLFPDGPQVLDLGGFIPRVDPDRDADQYAPTVAVIAGQLAERGWLHTQVLLELGSAVTTHAMSVAARVIDVCIQSGRTVANIAASVLHTSPNARWVGFPVRLIPSPCAGRTPTAGPVYLGGSTPIDGDWVSLDGPLAVAPGDFVMIDAVGAYSIGFDTILEPSLPILLRTGDGWRTARRPPEFDERFAGFVFP